MDQDVTSELPKEYLTRKTTIKILFSRKKNGSNYGGFIHHTLFGLHATYKMSEMHLYVDKRLM